MNFKKIVGKSIVVIALSTHFASSAYAEESKASLQADAKEQLSILQERQDQKQQLETQMKTTESELQKIQSSMSSLQGEIGQVKEEITQVTEQINGNKKEIITLEESMYARQDLIKERLVAMQQNSKDNIFIDILLNSESIADLIQKAHSVLVLFGADRDILDTQQADLEQLEKVKATIEKNEQTLKDRQQQLTNKQDELAGLETEQQDKLQEIHSKYEKVGNEIELTKSEQEKIETKLAALEVAAKKEAELQAAVAKAEEAKSMATDKTEVTKPVETVETDKVAETEATPTEKAEPVTTDETKEVKPTITEKTEEAEATPAEKTEEPKTDTTTSEQVESTGNTTSSAESTESSDSSQESSQESKTIYVTATAYTPDDSTTGKTVTGFDIWANPNARIIAVDPNIIPLGSTVWVEGYGEAIAADTGGAIKGYKIDVLLPTTADALNWGRQTVKVIMQN